MTASNASEFLFGAHIAVMQIWHAMSRWECRGSGWGGVRGKGRSIDALRIRE